MKNITIPNPSLSFNHFSAMRSNSTRGLECDRVEFDPKYSLLVRSLASFIYYFISVSNRKFWLLRRFSFVLAFISSKSIGIELQKRNLKIILMMVKLLKKKSDILGMRMHAYWHFQLTFYIILM